MMLHLKSMFFFIEVRQMGLFLHARLDSQKYNTTVAF